MNFSSEMANLILRVLDDNLSSCPAECPELAQCERANLICFTKIEQTLKKNEYVKLADDQSRPSINEAGMYEVDLENLYREGWRRVDLPLVVSEAEPQ